MHQPDVVKVGGYAESAVTGRDNNYLNENEVEKRKDVLRKIGDQFDVAQ